MQAGKEKSDSYIARQLLDVQRPPYTYSEEEFSALVANSLTFKGEPHSFLLLAQPGDGSTCFGSRVRERLHELSLVDFNFVHFNSQEDEPSGYPYAVQVIIGKKLRSIWFQARMSWGSLKATERLSYSFLYVTYLIVLYAISLAIVAWEKNEPLGLSFSSFSGARAWVSSAALTIVGSILPAAMVALWKAGWRSLSEEDLDSRRDDFLAALRRNNYAFLRARFSRRFARKAAPMMVVVDSLDELDQDFDTDFLYQYIFRARGSRVVVVAFSKFPSEHRIRYFSSMPNMRVFSLAPLGIGELEKLSGAAISSRITIKEVLGLAIRNEERLTEMVGWVAEVSANYPSDEWNPWTLLCLVASADHLDRHGFTRQGLMKLLVNNRDVLGAVGRAVGINEAPSIETINSSVQELCGGATFRHHILSFDKNRASLFIDSLARREILRRAGRIWKVSSPVFWLSERLASFKLKAAARTAFEMEYEASELLDELVHLDALSPQSSEIRDISSLVIAQIRFAEYGTLSRTVAQLYFQAGGSSASEVSTDDALAFEALLKHGLARQADVVDLVKRILRCSALPLVLDLAQRTLLGTPLDQSQEQALQTLVDRPENEITGTLRWFMVERARSHYVLPMLVLEEPLLQWRSYVGMLPSTAGGFNLATFMMLHALADANRVGDEEAVERCWSILVKGVLTVVRQSQSEWEQTWGEFGVLALLSEATLRAAKRESDPIYGQDAFRRDLSLAAFEPTSLASLRSLGEVVGLKFPDERTSNVPVSVLAGILSAIDALRVKLLLLSLDGLASILTVYRARVLLATCDVPNIKRELLNETSAELQRLADLPPFAAHRSLPLEALLLLYELHLKVHRSLSSDTIISIIKRLEELGVSPELIGKLFKNYTQELLFSHDPKKLRVALRMVIRALRSGGGWDSFARIDYHLLLASNFFNLHKRSFAKYFWGLANGIFKEFSGKLKSQEDVAIFRDLEIKLFVSRAEIWEEDGEELWDQIQSLLSSVDYQAAAAAGWGFMHLVALGLTRLPAAGLQACAKAIESLGGRDWYSGYLWSISLRRLVGRLGAGQSQEDLRYPLNLVLGKLASSDLSGVDIEQAIEDLRYMQMLIVNESLGTFGRELDIAQALNEKLLRLRLSILNSRALAFREVGSIGELAHAYYRLIGPYIEERLPGKLREWREVKSYGEFKAQGLAYIRHYQGIVGVQGWVALYVARHLEMRSGHEGDHEFQDQLGGIWLQIGVRCVESLLNAAADSPMLPSSVKQI